MTLAALSPYTYYSGDGVTTAFAYPFEVERPEDFVAFQGDTLVSNYTLSGVGEETGGQCTFSAPPALGVSILLLRLVPLDQETMYPAYSPFPAAAHEKTLDRLCMQIWTLQEQLDRTTRFKQTIPPQYRNLEYPDPIPNGVLGWDAAAQEWTYHPASGVQAITVNPTSGVGSGKNVVAVTPLAGDGQASVLVFPAGVLAIAVTGWIHTTFGTSQDLEAIGIGTPEQPDKWGYLTQLTAGAESTAGLFVGYNEEPMLGGGLVTLTAYGGAFDGTGTMYVTGHFQTFQPAHTLGLSYTPGGEDEPPLQAVGTPLAVARYNAAGTALEASPLVAVSATGQLSVGTTTPSATLTLQGSARQLQENASALVIQEVAATNTALSGGLTVNRSTGTLGARAAIAANTTLLTLTASGHTGTAHQPGAQVQMVSEEAFSETARGTRYTVATTTLGTATLTERLRIDARGNLTTDGKLPGTGLSKGLVLALGTAATAAHPTDAVQLWVENQDGAANAACLVVRGSGGTETRLGHTLLTRYSVGTVSANPVTTPYVLTIAESGRYYFVNGTELQQLTLPATASPGTLYHVTTYTASGVRVRAQSSNLLRLAGTNSAANGYIQSTTVGDYLTLIKVSGAVWQAWTPPQGWTLGT